MASAAPLLAVQGGDELVVSPELALVDPQLGALARARLPQPPPVDRCERPAPHFEPALGSAAEPAITVVGRWLLSTLFAVSIAGNVVALRYAWDDNVSPGAEPAVIAPAPPHVLGTSDSKSTQAVGAAKALAMAAAALRHNPTPASTNGLAAPPIEFNPFTRTVAGSSTTALGSPSPSSYWSSISPDRGR